MRPGVFLETSPSADERTLALPATAGLANICTGNLNPL